MWSMGTSKLEGRHRVYDLCASFDQCDDFITRVAVGNGGPTAS